MTSAFRILHKVRLWILLTSRAPGSMSLVPARDVKGMWERCPRSRSVATAHTPNHDLVAAPFANSHIATEVSASISPIIVVTISPIVIVPIIIIATFTLTPTLGSDTDVHLSERDRRLGRDRITPIFGECWESPHCARDGGDKQQFSHSNLLPCRH